MSAPLSLADAAELLSASPDFRVLRRFVPRTRYTETLPGTVLKTGLFVDVETTGLDTETAHVIEFALVPFEFDGDGRVHAVGAGLSFFNDPWEPIAPEITALTGITDDDVRGQSIDVALVDEALRGAHLVVAHNAEFDRPIIERALPAFARMAWACSYQEVEWQQFGCIGKKLGNILEGATREFFAAHRATDDCHAGVHALAAAKLDGRTALSYLLESARQPTVRVWADGSDYAIKGALKQRGYHWAGDPIKCWRRNMRPGTAPAEVAWLASEHRINAHTDRFNAFDRYSVRAS